MSIPARRAGRFGTKGLAITFVSSDADQQVMGAIQSRFEVAVPELPDHIDPASYSAFILRTPTADTTNTDACSDVMKPLGTLTMLLLRCLLLLKLYDGTSLYLGG